MFFRTAIFLPLVPLLFLASCATKANLEPKPKPYPFDYCAVIRKPFDKSEGAKYTRVHDGYEVKFCCTPCVKAFDVNPEPFMPPIRAYYGDTGGGAATGSATSQ